MPLRPDEIENREFASSLRGFDKHEVRAFLRRIASDVDELETQLTDREAVRGEPEHALAPSSALAEIDEDRFAALGDRIAGLLRQAHEAAAETREQADERARQLRSTAEDELEQARVEASRFREEAEAVALALRTSAEDDSTDLRGEAESLRAEADRLHAEAVAVRNEAEDHANHLRGEADWVRAEAEDIASRLRGEAEGLRAEADRLHTEAVAVRNEAEDFANHLRGEALALRTEADEYAARIRGEAENDAVVIRDRAELEGAARLDERRLEIEQAQAEVESDRLAAIAEVAEARGQVTTLLEEARAQSEFIKREAEEIIRAKVRTNIDQAQRRIDLLRNTETSSRNRILTAQRELEAALARLDTDAGPELGNQTEEDVLVEAEQRSLEADYPPFRSAEPEGSFVVGESGESDQVIEAHVIEGHLTDVQVAGFDVIEGDVIEGEVLEDEFLDDADEMAQEAVIETTADVMSEGPETSYRPSADVRGEDDEPEDEIEGGEPETESPAAPENEDALARLVREAMQRAVEGARNENR